MNEPECKRDAHPRGYHVERRVPPEDPTVDDRDRLVLVCKHPAHGPEGLICGPEAECFPTIVASRALWPNYRHPSPVAPAQPPTQRGAG